MPPTPLREVFAKFSRKFFENVGAKNFSKSRSRRRDQFGPKIVQIRAILAIFEPFEVLGCQKKSNFRTAVYPPRIAPFGLKLWENAFQTIPDISSFDVRGHICLGWRTYLSRDDSRLTRALRRCLPKNSLGVRTADSLSGKGITAPQRWPLQPQWPLNDPSIEP